MSLLVWGFLKFFFSQHQNVCAEKEFEKYWTSVLDKEREISGKLLRSKTCLSVIDYAAGFVCFPLWIYSIYLAECNDKPTCAHARILLELSI
jgi:hypothetical protein